MSRRLERAALRIVRKANANQQHTEEIRNRQRKFYILPRDEESVAIPGDIERRFFDQYDRATERLIQGDLTLEEARFLRNYTGAGVYTISDTHRNERRYGVRRLGTKTLDEVFDELDIGQSE